MFEWLAEFDHIFVTGPQRSGTRICAKTIAQDTGHAYIDEKDFGYDSLYGLGACLENRHRLVVQCPALCRYVHLFSADDTAIVLMRRNLQDIVASQKRINWAREWLELGRYDRSAGAIAEIKYQFWEENQKRKIKHAFEVEYESLAQHPLWVDQSLRHDFGPEQTTKTDSPLVMDRDACPWPHSDVFYWEKSDPDTAILVKTKAPVKLLNATGQMIWSLCDGKHTRQNILKSLKEQFTDVEESVLLHDFDEFVKDLVAKGFLQVAARVL